MNAALIVEGGGMRGVFAAGVLDCFLENRFDPFDAYFGVSAGACNLASHLGNQQGRNYRCYTDYMLKPDFFSLKKFLRGGHYMDLDWLWDYLVAVEPLNASEASKRDFHVVVTNAQTGKTEYLRAEEQTLFDALKGSSALPLLYRGFVTLGGRPYLDGGVADSIPVQEAYRRGARRIMVIRSQVAGYRKDSVVETRWIPLLFQRYPALRKALAAREASYNAVLDFIRYPPADVRILEICPAVLHSGRTTRNRKRLNLDYAEGKRMGLHAIHRWENG